MPEEGHGGDGQAARPPVLRLLVETRGRRSGQLAQGLVDHFGLAVLGGQRVAGGVAEQDGRRQRGGEEDVSVLLVVFGRGRGIAGSLWETGGAGREEAGPTSGSPRCRPPQGPGLPLGAGEELDCIALSHFPTCVLSRTTSKHTSCTNNLQQQLLPWQRRGARLQETTAPSLNAKWKKS